MGGLLDRMYAPAASMAQDARNREEAEELAYINAQKQAMGMGQQQAPVGGPMGDPTRIGMAEIQQDYDRLFGAPQQRQQAPARSNPVESYEMALINSGDPRAMQRGLDMRERRMMAPPAEAKQRRIISRKSDGRQFYEDTKESVLSDELYNQGVAPEEEATAFAGNAETAQHYNHIYDKSLPWDHPLKIAAWEELSQDHVETMADGSKVITRGKTAQALGVPPEIAKEYDSYRSSRESIKPVTAGEFKQQMQMESSADLIDRLGKAYKKPGLDKSKSNALMMQYQADTGIMGTLVGGAADLYKGEMTEDEANAVSLQEALGNQLIAAMRGASVGPEEQEKFERQLPRVGQPETLFNANLRHTKRNLKDMTERMNRRASGQHQSQTSGTMDDYNKEGAPRWSSKKQGWE